MKAKPELVRVIVKACDYSQDYWLSSARAKQLFLLGELSLVSVYKDKLDYLDPSAKYRKERIR